jgi:LacI family transcriptional regulator
MKDVAERVAISVQAVSVIANSKPGITPETQRCVFGVIEKFGYGPFSITRRMRIRRTRTVALVVSDITNSSFAIMARAAEDYAHEHSYNLIRYNAHDDIVRETVPINNAVEQNSSVAWKR